MRTRSLAGGAHGLRRQGQALPHARHVVTQVGKSGSGASQFREDGEDGEVGVRVPGARVSPGGAQALVGEGRDVPPERAQEDGAVAIRHGRWLRAAGAGGAVVEHEDVGGRREVEQGRGVQVRRLPARERRRG